MALAARAKSESCCEALLLAGADPNETDHEGVSALHWAVRWLSPEMVERLLSAGARVGAVAGDIEATPLHFACWEWRPEKESVAIVQALIRCGADPLARLKPVAPAMAKDWTPAEICVEFGRSGLWRLLEPVERSRREALEIGRGAGFGAPGARRRI